MQNEKTAGGEQSKWIPTSSVQTCYSKDWLLRTNEHKDIKDFICLICKQVVSSPMELTCCQHESLKDGLIVGEDCLKNFCENNDNSCPTEPHECKPFKSKASKKFIGNLLIMCPKQFEQDKKILQGAETCENIRCDFKGKLKDLQNHLDNECFFTLIDCWFKPFGCDHKCRKQNLNDHLVLNMKYHFNLVMELFQSMKQTIQLHRDISNKLNLEIDTLKKELNHKIENLRQETAKYHSDIE
ncbi:hypothetical protein RFI_27090, partial [Reticulomyxa filosa]